jgi:hypothetical protein
MGNTLTNFLSVCFPIRVSQVRYSLDFVQKVFGTSCNGSGSVNLSEFMKFLNALERLVKLGDG